MTRLRSLAAGLTAIAGFLIVGRAGAGGLNCDWTGGANTAWDNPANWTNCGGGIPGAADTAAITSVANLPVVSTATPVGGLSLVGPGTILTIASPGGNLTLDGTTTGAGIIHVGGTLTWIGGAMGGTGVTNVHPGGVLSLFNGASKVLDRNLFVLPGGTTTMTGGDSSLIITDTHVFASGGLFHIQNGSNITGAGRFDNLIAGTFRTSVSSGLVNITVEEWNNIGLVEVLSPTLSFAAGTFVHGGTYLFDTTRLYFPTGTHTVIGTFDGDTLEMNAPVNFQVGATLTTVDNVQIRGVATFNSGESLVFGTVLIDGGTFAGGDHLTTFFLNWPSGTITGSGILTIPTSGILNMVGSGVRMLDRNVYNSGAAGMNGAAGNLAIPSNRTFYNMADGSFTIANDSMITGEAVFENAGSFLRVLSPGPAIADFDFHNAGTVQLETGTTIFHHFHQTAGTTHLVNAGLNVVHEVVHLEGGTIYGVGDIFASIEASGFGTITPGDSAGTITVHGDYRQSNPAVYQAELGSPSDLIAASGQALLGGILDVTVNGPPVPNTDYVLLSYGSRVGKFGFAGISGPPPAGLSWMMRYGATEFSLRAQALLPVPPLAVDVIPAPGGSGNQNSVLEPGESVAVNPTWIKLVPGPILGVTGTASGFLGPMGATYDIVDAAAVYGTISGGAPPVNCAAFGADGCYTLSVNDPPIRPALHWDTTFDESLSDGSATTYTVHIGRSFLDVPLADGFYRFIETLLHHQVTSGCGGDSYCPGSFVTRAQMAVFLMVSKFGPAYLPPEATGTVFLDVPAASFAAAFIEDIAARQITSGCGGGNYCPGDSATREQMAVFLLRTLEGPTYVPPDCTEPPTFADVPCSSGFAKWIEELVVRGITAGCGGGLYCPAQAVNRGQMAVFLTATFGLFLNGA